MKLAYDSHIWEILTDSSGYDWQPYATYAGSQYPGGWIECSGSGDVKG